MNIRDIFDFLLFVWCICTWSYPKESILKKKLPETFSHWSAGKFDYGKGIRNYTTLTKCLDETTEPTVNYKVSEEKQFPCPSSGTLRL